MAWDDPLNFKKEGIVLDYKTAGVDIDAGKLDIDASADVHITTATTFDVLINKTYRGVLDGTHWYLHQPLIELGHDVLSFSGFTANDDTVGAHKILHRNPFLEEFRV